MVYAFIPGLSAFGIGGDEYLLGFRQFAFIDETNEDAGARLLVCLNDHRVVFILVDEASDDRSDISESDILSSVYDLTLLSNGDEDYVLLQLRRVGKAGSRLRYFNAWFLHEYGGDDEED